MAEPKRPMDGLERVLESSLLLACFSQTRKLGPNQGAPTQVQTEEGQAVSTNMRPPISICNA